VLLGVGPRITRVDPGYRQGRWTGSSSLHVTTAEPPRPRTVRLAGYHRRHPFALCGRCRSSGPHHGGANEGHASNMCARDRAVDRIPNCRKKAKGQDQRFRLMGLLAPVTKNLRIARTVMRESAHESTLSLSRLKDSGRSFKVAIGNSNGSRWKRLFRRKESWYPGTSTSIPASSSMRWAFPKQMFTVLFALARTVGWGPSSTKMIERSDAAYRRPRQILYRACPTRLPSNGQTARREPLQGSPRLRFQAASRSPLSSGGGRACGLVASTSGFVSSTACAWSGNPVRALLSSAPTGTILLSSLTMQAAPL